MEELNNKERFIYGLLKRNSLPFYDIKLIKKINEVASDYYIRNSVIKEVIEKASGRSDYEEYIIYGLIRSYK